MKCKTRSRDREDEDNEGKIEFCVCTGNGVKRTMPVKRLTFHRKTTSASVRDVIFPRRTFTGFVTCWNIDLIKLLRCQRTYSHQKSYLRQKTNFKVLYRPGNGLMADLQVEEGCDFRHFPRM